MTRTLGIFLIAMTLPQAALAAHGAEAPHFPRGTALGVLLQAHMAPKGTPVCHRHDDGTPFHCSCDGPFNLLCPNNMNLGEPELHDNLLGPRTPLPKIEQ